MQNKIKEIFTYRDMIGGLIHRDLRGRYKGSVLGFLWTFINPLCQIIVYYFVFKGIFRNDIPNFHIYLVSGMFAWSFFAESMIEGSGSIVALSDMTKKIYFPREVLPLAIVTGKLINFVLSLLVVVVIILFSKVGFSIHLVYLPLVLLIQYLLCVGLAILSSALTVYYRDIQYIINVLLMLAIWASPIMYEYTPTDAFFWKAVSLSPMTPLINAYHDIFFYHRTLDFKSLGLLFIFSVFFIIFAEFVFSKLEKKFAENL